MENLSKQDKKQLFLRLIEECDRTGRSDRVNEEGNVYHDAGYYRIWKIKNDGILGLWYEGLDKEGKHRVELIAGGALEERDYEILYRIDGPLIRSFSDNELDEFLDRFFDMNNMEALNEFGNMGYFEKNENYKTPSVNVTMNSLEYLNIMDYLNELSEGITFNAEESTYFKVGDRFLSDHILLAKDPEGFWIHGSTDKKEIVFMKFKQNIETSQYELIEKTGDENEIELLLDIVDKAMDDVPKIYQHLRAGTYKKEEFVTERNKQTPLQKRESKLAELEVEKQELLKEEALMQPEKEEGRNIGE
mgnify:CR=1 FL=1